MSGLRFVSSVWGRSRAAVRLARRDAARHRARTILATLLVALPIAALIAGTALLSPAPPTRDQALAGIPDGVQAVITATAISQDNAPIPQLPEGAPGPWIDDLEQVPAGEAELKGSLSSGARLLQYWNAPRLLVTTGIPLSPGEEAEAGVGITADTDLAGIATTDMQEADSEALTLLMPALTAGTAPATKAEAVITSSLADRLGLGIGDEIAVVAPPSTGWYSSDGRIGDVVADAQRGYRVSGIVDDEASHVWAHKGWISRMAADDKAGVDGHWLVVGDEPVTWAQATSMNQLQAFAVSRHVLTEYPGDSELYPVQVDINALLLQIAGIVLTGALGTALVLMLVTPAFAVSTDQSRRTLGLAAATGATPADLRRIVNAQGTVIGAAGGLLGAAVGVAIAFLVDGWIPPGQDFARSFPWWIVPTGIGVATLLGLITTLIPAASAARLQPVDALKDRPTPRRGTKPGRAKFFAIAGPVTILAAAVAGVLSLAGVTPTPEYTTPGTVPASAAISAVLLVTTVVLAIVGILLLVRAIPSLGARLAKRAPVASRLALHDAAEHRSRFVPAATAVLVTVCAASYFIVVTGSMTANDRDRVGEVVQGGSLVLGTDIPIGNEIDRLVITDTIDALRDALPINGHEPIYSASIQRDASLRFGAVQPLNRSCPEGLYPDTASSTKTGVPLVCTTANTAYSPSLSVPWWGGTDAGIMDSDALLATGMNGATAAAAVLEDGGIVVNNAARLSADGTVRVALSSDPLPTEENAEQFVELPGAFLRGFAFAATVSPDTATEIGVTDWEYVGEIVTADPELTPAQLTEARTTIKQHTSLVRMTEANSYRDWGRDSALIPIALLAALAVAASAISLLLAKTQSRSDVTTMLAVGATKRFLRRFTLSQAMVLLAAGVPLGFVAGIALGTYQIAWNRATGIGGAWIETVPLWRLQAGLGLTIIGASVLAVLVIGRPTNARITRTID